MSAPWWEGPLLAVDLETTGKDPETARIVTAACIAVGPQGVVSRQIWLADPGVEIPAEAAAVHGISTEKARAEGAPAYEVVRQIAEEIETAWADPAVPVVAMNAAYDLTIIQRELVRHSFEPLQIGPVLDPMVIDHAIDKYRKGSRKLGDLAKHYGVSLDNAHSADADALAAARVVWKQARHPRHGRALQLMTLQEMQGWQANAHRARCADLQNYLRTKATPRQPDAVIDPSWPVRLAPAQREASS